MKTKVELGKRPEETPYRDAVHVAVIAVTAGETLEPGAQVGIRLGVALKPTLKGIRLLESEIVGVVDPFLKTAVSRGAPVWVIINPGTVKDLRHTWTHEAIEDEEPEPQYEDDGCSGC